jgi:outer membrane protein OmpA-like peptidoglycan-associated protein
MLRQTGAFCVVLLCWMCSSAVAQRGSGPAAPPPVPLVVGLMTVSAVHEPNEGDYETIVKFNEVSAAAVGYTVSGNVDDRRYSVRRKMTRDDFTHAHTWRPRYNEGDPEVFAGTTGATLSLDVLTELKTKGRAAIKARVADDPVASLLGGLFGGAGSDVRKAMGGAGDAAMDAGTLTRVEPGTVPVPMLVNDVRVDLPAVHARGTLGDEPFEVYLLDNAAIPVLLRWNVGDTSKRMVKISYPVERATDPIEEKLNTVGRAEVYGIYFDFAKATIRPESEPVLEEIADVMAKNPAWKLSVEGHTDNIGTASSNLDLSTRRAAAVRQALVDRYKVAGARLTPAGYGASRPKDTNDTLEGRARNRRVELARQP